MPRFIRDTWSTLSLRVDARQRHFTAGVASDRVEEPAHPPAPVDDAHQEVVDDVDELDDKDLDDELKEELEVDEEPEPQRRVIRGGRAVYARRVRRGRR